MNHTRFPKEDHLPDSALRDNKVTKGDRVERISVALHSQLDTQLPHVNLSFTINHFEKDYLLIYDAT